MQEQHQPIIKYIGFSLIEMLVIVAMIGVLLSLAVPTYQEHLRKSKRAEAQSALLEWASIAERQFTEDANYEAITCTMVASSNCQIPTNNPEYQLSITKANNNQDFTMTASPLSSSDLLNGDYTYTISHTGLKTRSRNGQVENTW